MPRAVYSQKKNEGQGDGGKPADVGRLVREFAPLVRRIARRYEGRGADREDLEQEGYAAMIEIARRHGSREMGKRLKRHLPGYVRDAAAKMWRPASCVSISDDEQSEGVSLSELLPDPHAGEDVEEFELMDALERFLEQDEMALACALADGLTQQEIAEATGRSRATEGRRIARLRARLRG